MQCIMTRMRRLPLCVGLTLMMWQPVTAHPTPLSDAEMLAHAERIEHTRGMNPLFQARLLTLLPMIAEGFPVDGLLPAHKGNTALHYACAIGDLELVSALLKRGANPRLRTHKGATPHLCASGPHRAGIQKLLANPPATKPEPPPAPPSPQAPPAQSPSVTVPAGEVEQMQDYLRGISPRTARGISHKQQLTELLTAMQNGSSIDHTLPGTGGFTALHHACALDDFVLAIWLLENGARPHARTQKGLTPQDLLHGGNAAFIRAHLTEFTSQGKHVEHKDGLPHPDIKQ